MGTLRYTPAGPAVLVPNSTSLIKRTAFGNNTDGSCGAVASTIALNYLDKTQNGDIVPANMEMEQLVGNSFVASTYPKADRFHKFLRDTCQMGIYVLPGDIVTGIANYSASSNAIARTGISLKWFNVDRYDIMNEILDGRPA